MTVAYKKDGHTFKEPREAFNIPAETFYKWEERLEKGHYDIEKGIQKRHRKIDREILKQVVIQKLYAYLYELTELFDCSETAIFYMLQKLNITLKKRPLPIVKNQN